MQIEPVIWDSEFFKLKIGKIEPNQFNAIDFNSQKRDYDLIYLFELPESEINKEIIAAGAKLVDVKLTYQKKILPHNIIIDEKISHYNASEPSEKLIELSLQSGEYSRFKLDSNFNNMIYKKLYTEWIKKSCNRSIAFDILIHGNELNPDGFITITQKNKDGQIGLIAVDAAARGKGIGKKLIFAAEFIAENHNFEILKVITQAANSNACSLYEKCGFVIDNSLNIYHYWNNK